MKSQSDFTFADSTFEVGESMNGECVIFEFDKPIIKKESLVFLDSMVSFLNRNETIKMEVQNHTDSRAKITYSINLTERRAEAVVDYLISKGIAKERLIPKGYFNKRLLISDAEIKAMKSKEEQELAHQKNRRTTFVIIAI